jgi:hypothetical protein
VPSGLAVGSLEVHQCVSPCTGEWVDRWGERWVWDGVLGLSGWVECWCRLGWGGVVGGALVCGSVHRLAGQSVGGGDGFCNAPKTSIG